MVSEKQTNLLLHLYQPPWQFSNVLEKIIDESYLWVSDWILKNEMKVTINMNYSLTEQLLRTEKGSQVIDNIRQGQKKGVIELTNSAAYHAFLPLISSESRKNQLNQNKKLNEKAGLNVSDIVFPPEMGVSSSLISDLKDLNCLATITDAPVLDAISSDHIPYDYVATKYGLPVFFRNNVWSNEFSSKRPDAKQFDLYKFAKDYASSLDRWFSSDFSSPKGYSILAFDGETLGHHHKKFNKNSLTNFHKGLRDSNVEAVHLKDLLNLYPFRKEIVPDINGSWSTQVFDIKQGIYFPMWQHPDNNIHKKQWDLYDFVESVVKTVDDPIVKTAFSKAQHSCQFWQADTWRFNQYLVEISSNMLIKTLEETKRADWIEKGNKLFSDFKKEVKIEYIKRME